MKASIDQKGSSFLPKSLDPTDHFTNFEDEKELQDRLNALYSKVI